MARNSDIVALGQRIVSARERVGLRQADLARALNTTTTSVCRWETGRQKPGLKSLQKIAKLTQLSVDYLVTGNLPDLKSGSIPLSRHRAFLQWLKSEDAENLTDDEKISLASLRFALEPRIRRYTNILEQLRNYVDIPKEESDVANENSRKIK